MTIAVFDVEDWKRAIFDRLREVRNLTLCSHSLTVGDADEFDDAKMVTAFL